MVKSRAEVEEKMRDRVSTAGKYLRQGMEAAEDPLAVLLKDPAKAAKKHAAGVIEAHRRGSFIAGLKKAKARNSWKESLDRAGAHFEERTEDMVDNAMESYDARASAIERAQARVADLPTTTRAQRIAKSGKYQEYVGEEFDKVFGRKG